MKSLFKILKLLVVVSILSLTQITLASGPDDCTTPQDWRVFGGINYNSCRDGLFYPTINAFKEFNILQETTRTNAIRGPEHLFAYVSKVPSGSEKYNFQDSITLQKGETARMFNYIHNTGSPRCNSEDQRVLQRNNCPRSTTAKDVQIKIISGLVLQANGDYTSIANRNGRHVITLEISSSNTTPRKITDTFTINTQPNEVIKLINNQDLNYLSVCTQFGTEREDGSKPCSSFGRNYYTLNQLANTGIPIRVSHSNVNSNDFFASTDYRVQLYGAFTVIDAPVEPNFCTSMKLEAPRIDLNARTANYQLAVESNLSASDILNLLRQTNAFTANPSGSLNYSLDSQTRNSFAGNTKYYNLEINQVDSGDSFRLVLPGYQSSCSVNASYTARSQCQNLVLGQRTQSGNTYTYPYTVTPANQTVTCQKITGNGTVEVNSRTQTITISNPNASTQIECKVDEGRLTNPVCQKPITFTDLQGELCSNITMQATNQTTGNKYIIKGGQTETVEPGRYLFNVISTSPTSFNNGINKLNWRVDNGPEQAQTINQPVNTGSPLSNNRTISYEIESGKGVTNHKCYGGILVQDNNDGNECIELKAYIKNERNLSNVNNNNAIIPTQPGKVTILHLEPIFSETQDPATEYLDKIQARISSGNVGVARLQDQGGRAVFALYNGGQNSSVTFNIQDVDNPECSSSIRFTASNNAGENAIEVTKRIISNRQPTTQLFTDINKPIQFKVEYKILIPELKDQIKVIDLKDPIQNEIKGTNKNNQTNNAVLKLNNDIAQNGNSFSYIGIVDWTNRNQDCKNFTQDCAVTFTNYADVIAEFELDSDNNIPLIARSNNTYVAVLCPFILSRGFGDVYLEKEFSTGVDLAACSNRNTQSPVFTAVPNNEAKIPSTGTSEIQQINQASNAICKAANTKQDLPNELKPYFQNPTFNNFSSSVCETAIKQSEKWQKQKINTTILNNITRLDSKLITSPLNTLDDTTLPTGLFTPKVFKIESNLNIENDEDVTIKSNTSKTIIVYGDLNINSNIKYDPDSKGTIAFLVIGGNINIKPGVTEINGVYAVIPKDNSGGKIQWASTGNSDVTENGSSDQPILIKGSVYGDIDPLFAGVTSGGDLSRDRGGVTVIYDGRITRRVPPGLDDVIKFNQFQTAIGSPIFSTDTSQNN